MARTISDIQRRKLEEQEAMDRIAMQREMMAGQDRRFDAGISADERAASLLAKAKFDAVQSAQDWEVESNEDMFYNPDGSVGFVDVANSRAGQLNTLRGETDIETATRTNAFGEGRIRLDDLLRSESASNLLDQQRSDTYTGRQIADIIGDFGGNPDMARGAILESGLATEDNVDVMLALGTEAYSDMLNEQGNFGMLRYPAAAALNFGLPAGGASSVPDPTVTDPPVVSGNGMGTPERAGQIVGGIGNYFGNQFREIGDHYGQGPLIEHITPSHLGDQLGDLMDPGYQATQLNASMGTGDGLKSAWENRAQGDGGMARFFRAKQIADLEAKYERREITEDQLEREITALEAAAVGN